MQLYSREKDSTSKEYQVINQEEAKNIGWNLNDLEVGFDGKFYFLGFAPEPPVPTYAEARAVAYPEVIEQLDCLYHDIDSGLLGEDAKESSFYLARKAVKDEFPKPEDLINISEVINES